MQHGDNSIFTMNEAQALEYVKNRQEWFEDSALLSCEEIGDGNLNYVFRIRDDHTGQSVILKQAGPVARISDAFVVSTQRNRLEYLLLKEYNRIVPAYVPKVYHYDEARHCFAMEDLSSYRILRQGLLAGSTYEYMAEHMAAFMAVSHLLNLDWVLGGKAKKLKMSDFINPDLCEITEDLVLTEPFYDCPRNVLSSQTKAIVKALLWEDELLLHKVHCLKWQFMTDTETLIHGDLHTGSVFVNERQTKVIDHEFACFGPAGFDLGSFLANLIFAKLHQEAKGNEATYLKDTLEALIQGYMNRFKAIWREMALKDEALLNLKLSKILKDAAGYGGCELIRRVVGIAKVADITSLEPPLREMVEARAIVIGKRLIMEAEACIDPAAFLNRIEDKPLT